MEKQIRFFFLFTAVLCVMALPVLAVPITQTRDFNCVSSSHFILTFNKFDNNGGLYALNSIKFDLSLRINGGTLIIDNDGDNNASGTFEFGIFENTDSAEVNLPPTIPTASLFYSQAFSLDSNTGDGIGDYDSSAPDGLQFTGSSNSSNISAFLDNAFWNDYIGTGTYSITVDIAPWTDCSGSDTLEFSVTKNVNVRGCINVVYDYDTIPEPATIILLVCGFSAFVKKNGSKTNSPVF